MNRADFQREEEEEGAREETLLSLSLPVNNVS